MLSIPASLLAEMKEKRKSGKKKEQVYYTCTCWLSSVDIASRLPEAKKGMPRDALWIYLMSWCSLLLGVAMCHHVLCRGVGVVGSTPSVPACCVLSIML